MGEAVGAAAFGKPAGNVDMAVGEMVGVGVFVAAAGRLQLARNNKRMVSGNNLFMEYLAFLLC
jgi:hypothetical protein